MAAAPATFDASRVALAATFGAESLDFYAEQLARRVQAQVVRLRTQENTFNHPLLSKRSHEIAVEELRTLRLLRAQSADLVHLTSHHLARYGPLLGTPFVVTVHDLMRYRDWRERGRRPPLIHSPNLRDRFYVRLDVGGIRRADAVIAVSEHTRRDLVDLLGLDPDRIHVVYPGVDHEAFRPVERRLLEDPYVLYVGSEQPRKNLGTLLESFAALRSELGEPRLKLVKVGGPGGSEGPFREMTLEAVDRFGLREHVIFSERVSEEELVAWYSGALCLALPSRHEGFGLPPIEAMACGCPVVVSRAGALPEVVGEAALVYGAPDDRDALTDALARVIRTEDERDRLRAAGLRHAEMFSWDRTAAGTLAVYASISFKAGDGPRH